MERSELLKKYLEHEMFTELNIQRFDDPGMCDDTPLHLAAMNGDAEDVAFMLREVASPDVPGDIGCTPLHMAVMFGNPGVVDVLLKHGARIDAENEYGDAPLHFLGRNAEEMMEAVRRYHPGLQPVGEDGQSA